MGSGCAHVPPCFCTCSVLLACLQEKVSAPTLEGRKLRRGVLKGAVIAFVTAGYSGKRFIFEKAKELGAKCIVLDGPDRCVGAPDNAAVLMQRSSAINLGCEIV